MASPIKPRRVVAAGVLSLSLIAPSVVIPQAAEHVLPAAAAQTADAFNDRYTTGNFWNEKEAVVEGLTLEPGTTVESTTKTIFNWNFRNDGGQLVLIRPQSSTAYKTGDVDIRVKVTPANGSAYRTTLKVNVVDEDTTPPAVDEEPVDKQSFDDRYPTANFWNKNEAVVEGLTLQPGTTVNPTTNTIFNWNFRNDNGELVLIRPQSGTAFRTGEVDIPVRVTEENGASYNTTLKVTTVDENPEPAAQPVDEAKFNDRYDTANFWNEQEAAVEGLELDPGTTVKPTANTIFNWNFRNDDGQLVLIRPQSPAGYKAGNADIRVRVEEANGATYNTTLKVNVIDARTLKEWEQQLAKSYTIDFEKSKEAKPIADLTIPAGVTLSKAGITPPPGWVISVEDGTVLVEPPATFTEGYVELPVRVNDGTDSFEMKLKINAKNPQTSTTDITSGVGKTIGSIIGGLLGVPNLGNILGGGSGGSGGSGEGGSGRLVNVVITNNANNNGSPNIIITNNANPVVTNNANNNGSNNGSNNSVIVTDNVNPRDNLSNNGSNNSAVITNNANPVITNNANPNVEIKDNGNPSVVVTNNANPSVVITGNANPTVDIRDNASNNGSNNSAVVSDNANPSVVITGNANPVITNNANPNVDIRDNASNNGSNNSAVVSDNANPSVVITDNANPRDNFNNNGNPVVTGNANPSVVITGNANPTVDIKDNGSNNASNNTADIKDNGNPIVTGNANPTVGGGLGSALGGSSKRDKGNGDGGDAGANGGKSGSSNRGGSSIGADVEATGGLTDPRCVASLAGLGLPLLLAIPVALAQGLNTPGIDQLAAQAAGALNDTARNFGVDPAQVTAIAGGVVGATLAVVGALALATCIPDVQKVGITVGGPKTVTETTSAPAPAATVVTNPTEPTVAA